jgi:hypothetical protein
LTSDAGAIRSSYFDKPQVTSPPKRASCCQQPDWRQIDILLSQCLRRQTSGGSPARLLVHLCEQRAWEEAQDSFAAAGSVMQKATAAVARIETANFMKSFSSKMYSCAIRYSKLRTY